MAKGDPVVRLQDLRKSFGTLEVLRGVNLEVGRGEVLCIIGPSGSGKSTLLRCVAYLEDDFEGRIYLEGDLLGRVERNGRLERVRGAALRRVQTKVGLIFQNFNLIPTMSASENVGLALAFAGIRGRQRARRAEELLSRVGLGERLTHKPAELSGGEQQRVAIARALANQPRVLLADEPTGNLDSTRAHELLFLLRQMVSHDSLSILMVTHDHELAHSFADRIVFMKDGRVVSQAEEVGGAVDDVLPGGHL